MIDRLRSHLRRLQSAEKGFTLIELLVVIAIIAILVIIIVFAINPVARIRDANDRRAGSDIRSIGQGIQACITDQLGKGTDPAVIYVLNWGGAAAAGDVGTTDHIDRQCGNRADLVADGYLSNAPNTLSATTTNIDLDAGATLFCVWGRAGSGQGHNHWALMSTDQATWTFSGANVLTNKDTHAAAAGANVQPGGKSEIFDVGVAGGTQSGNPTGC